MYADGSLRFGQPFFIGLALALFTLAIVGMKLGEAPASRVLVGVALPVVLLAHKDTPRGLMLWALAGLTAMLAACVAVIVYGV